MKGLKEYLPTVYGVIFGVFSIALAYIVFGVSVGVVGSVEHSWLIDKVKDAKFFDLAIFVALATFFLKERLDTRRKLKEQGRKISAVKALLVDELELNHFCLKRLRGIFKEASVDADEGEERPVLEYVVLQGMEYFASKDVHGHRGMTPIPIPTFKYYDRFIDVVAELDGDLFVLVQAAYAKIRVMEHVRESLVRHLQSDETANMLRPGDIRDSGFLEYAVDELEEVYPHINALYRKCTGVELKNTKVR